MPMMAAPAMPIAKTDRASKIRVTVLPLEFMSGRCLDQGADGAQLGAAEMRIQHRLRCAPESGAIHFIGLDAGSEYCLPGLGFHHIPEAAHVRHRLGRYPQHQLLVGSRQGIETAL